MNQGDIIRAKNVIEGMIKSAEKWNKDEVIRLNRIYSSLKSKMLQPKDLEANCQECVDYCVSSVGVAQGKHDELVKLAKQIYTEIKWPDYNN